MLLSTTHLHINAAALRSTVNSDVLGVEVVGTVHPGQPPACAIHLSAQPAELALHQVQQGRQLREQFLRNGGVLVAQLLPDGVGRRLLSVADGVSVGHGLVVDEGLWRQAEIRGVTLYQMHNEGVLEGLEKGMRVGLGRK